ncbi:MAG: hypothetical protein LBU66_07405 [Treponema sp.]|nr:hypothetical protein [Treponema sp.]
MKINYRKLIYFRHIATRILYLCLIISFATLIIYLFDFNFNDKLLFSLLIILRYSSFIVCICSFHKLIINTFHIFRRPSFKRVFHAFLYIAFIVYGAAMIFLEAFITAIAIGNN